MINKGLFYENKAISFSGDYENNSTSIESFVKNIVGVMSLKYLLH